MPEGQLFDPDYPPQSQEQLDARLEEIKAELRNQPGWFRHKDRQTKSGPKAVDYGKLFHDRREDS